MKITIEVTDGELREILDQYNESAGLRRGLVGHVTMLQAKQVLKSPQLRAALVERALELATESCVDMLRLK